MDATPYDTETPISPIYPTNHPNEDILLHEGPITVNSDVDVTGSIRLKFTPEPRIAWQANKIIRYVRPGSEVTLAIEKNGLRSSFPAYFNNFDSWNTQMHGHANSITIGDPDAPLGRIVAHWFNLPDIHGTIGLSNLDDAGCGTEWNGRWRSEASGWQVTIDVRPGHPSNWRDLNQSNTYVMTHIMELSRTDGSTFTANDATPILSALHTGVSFAWGRWVAPMLPVGISEKGEVTWEEWKPLHCDYARKLTSGWWYHQDLASLESLCQLLIAEFLDENKREARRLQLMMAIEAVKDSGFAEQRIIMGTAGLEHLMWQSLVLEGDMTEAQYHGKEEYTGKYTNKKRDMEPTHKKLRALLKCAEIPLKVDPNTLSSAAEYTQRKSLSDGAGLVPNIRNCIVHPVEEQERIYATDGLIKDAWLLTRHYLALLILHSLGFKGKYRDMTKLTGSASDIERVYWAR